MFDVTPPLTYAPPAPTLNDANSRAARPVRSRASTRRIRSAQRVAHARRTHVTSPRRFARACGGARRGRAVGACEPSSRTHARTQSARSRNTRVANMTECEASKRKAHKGTEPKTSSEVNSSRVDPRGPAALRLFSALISVSHYGVCELFVLYVSTLHC